MTVPFYAFNNSAIKIDDSFRRAAESFEYWHRASGTDDNQSGDRFGYASELIPAGMKQDNRIDAIRAVNREHLRAKQAPFVKNEAALHPLPERLQDRIGITWFTQWHAAAVNDKAEGKPASVWRAELKVDFADFPNTGIDNHVG